MKLLINEFLQKNGKMELYHQQQILVKWSEMVENTLLRNTKAKKIENGVLYISNVTAAQRFELMGMRSLLIEQLNKSVESDILKGIIIN